MPLPRDALYIKTHNRDYGLQPARCEELRRVHRRHSRFKRATILVEYAQGQYTEPGSPLRGLDLGVDYLLAA